MRFYERDDAYVIAEEADGTFYLEGWSNFIGYFPTLDEARERVVAEKARRAQGQQEYIDAFNASGGKGWEHAGCDHAYGICSGGGRATTAD